jgi:hypothetical protein
MLFDILAALLPRHYYAEFNTRTLTAMRSRLMWHFISISTSVIAAGAASSLIFEIPFDCPVIA